MKPLRLRAAGAGLVLAGLVLAGCTHVPGDRAPANLDTAKSAVVAYHDSGAYLEDVAAVAAEADAWISRRAAQRGPGERLGVVFDIDETVLSSYPHMRAQDFGYVPAVWRAWVDQGAAPALAPVRDVYRTARRLGLDVFFITGRRDPAERPGTEANLAREGMGEYTRLILAPADGAHGSSGPRKAAARAALTAEGFTIIASIGDQQSDLVGGHAERTFKLPNPFYFVP